MFICSCVSGHLGCFRFWAVLNNAAINIGIQVSVQDFAFSSFGNIPRSRISGSCSNSVFFFWGITILFYSSCNILHFSGAGAFQFLHIFFLFSSFLSLFFFSFFYLMSVKWYFIVIVLICISLMDWWCWASFHVLGGHLYNFFGYMSVKILYPISNWLIGWLGF